MLVQDFIMYAVHFMYMCVVFSSPCASVLLKCYNNIKQMYQGHQKVLALMMTKISFSYATRIEKVWTKSRKTQPVFAVLLSLMVFMRGSRKFCLRGSNFDNVFFSLFFFSLMWEEGSNYHY